MPISNRGHDKKINSKACRCSAITAAPIKQRRCFETVSCRELTSHALRWRGAILYVHRAKSNYGYGQYLESLFARSRLPSSKARPAVIFSKIQEQNVSICENDVVSIEASVPVLSRAKPCLSASGPRLHRGRPQFRRTLILDAKAGQTTRLQSCFNSDAEPRRDVKRKFAVDCLEPEPEVVRRPLPQNCHDPVRIVGLIIS